MNELLIHGLAVLLQLLAITLAIYVIRLSGRNLAWLLLSAAFLLQGVRRVLEFLVEDGNLEMASFHSVDHWLALAISILIVAGVYHIREIFIAGNALRQRLEQQLLEVTSAHREWTTAFDAVSSPIFMHDGEYRILRANRAYVACAGKPFKEIIGQTYWRIFPRLDAPLPSCIWCMENKVRQ